MLITFFTIYSLTNPHQQNQNNLDDKEVHSDEDHHPLDTINYSSPTDDLSNKILRYPRNLSVETSQQKPIPLRDLAPFRTEADRREDSAEASLRRIEQASPDSTNHAVSADAMQDTPRLLAMTKMLEGQHHLRWARDQIMQDRANKKPIEVPPQFSLNRLGNIGKQARYFEPRTDPKQQLMRALYGDENWDPHRLLEEMDEERSHGPGTLVSPFKRRDVEGWCYRDCFFRLEIPVEVESTGV